jgi:3-isopropylmalate/(R)-2-methylmalate dehydratase small subunit
MNRLSAIVGNAWVYGDAIDTDVLAPGMYMKKPIAELARHCLEAIDPRFANAVRVGDVLVAGEGFGMGSSREQAVQALQELGVACVLARSCARIFYRNALNLGLPVLIVNQPIAIATGDHLRVDIRTGQIENSRTAQHVRVEPIPDFLLRMLADGGLLPHLRIRLANESVSSK